METNKHQPFSKKALDEAVAKTIDFAINLRKEWATSSLREIRKLVKDRVINLGYQGAYCVGSSNSVPNYVPFRELQGHAPGQR